MLTKPVFFSRILFYLEGWLTVSKFIETLAEMARSEISVNIDFGRKYLMNLKT